VPIDPRHPLVAHLPLLGIAITTPALTLAMPTLDELATLADRAAEGIHDPAEMPFSNAWTRTSPEGVARSVARYWLQSLAEITGGTGELGFVAFVDGAGPVGIQGLQLEPTWPTLATVTTGSWLGQRFQGRGYGTWMRRAILAFAFRVLGAQRAESSAHDGNLASRRVSERLGYREVGTSIELVEGKEQRVVHYRLERTDFVDDERIHISGVSDEVRELLRVANPGP
jgi:RimJ/RimL family protein N-acetyltransferase